MLVGGGATIGVKEQVRSQEEGEAGCRWVGRKVRRILGKRSVMGM